MAIKLFDLIGSFLNSFGSKELNADAVNKLSMLAEELETLDNNLEISNDAIKRLRTQVSSYNKGTVERIRLEQALKEELEDKKELEKRISTDTKEIGKITKLTGENLNEFTFRLKLYGIEAVTQYNNTIKQQKSLTGVLKGLGIDSRVLSAEFIELGFILEQTFEQIIKGNNLLVTNLIRKGKALTPKNLGFDNYGNNISTGAGSINSLSAINAINPETFFNSLEGFTGNVVGLGFNIAKSQKDLQNFAIQQSKLIDLYGVGADAVKSITEASSQLYGKNIKEINQTFSEGTKIVKASGLSVKQYFDNLAKLTDAIGDKYIADGISGLEKLAFTATKFNTSVDTFFAFGEKFNTLQELMEQHGNALALGFSNYGTNTGSYFAKAQTGQFESLGRQMISDIAKDLKANAYVDKNGLINNFGLRSLKQLGLNPEQTKVVQRFISNLHNANLTIEEYTDFQNLSFKKQLDYYEALNKTTTVTEKLGQIWGSFKSIFIDPLTSVLSPLLDVTLNGLVFGFKLLGFILKPIVFGFTILGKWLTYVTDKIGAVFSWLEEKMDKMGFNIDKLGGLFAVLSTTAAGLIAVLLIERAVKLKNIAIESLKGWGNTISKSLGGIVGEGSLLGNLMGKGGGAAAGGGALLGAVPKLIKGVGVGAIISGVGGMAGDAIGGKTGGIISGLADIGGGAATGAAIGSVVPVVGNVVGGIVGGIVGGVVHYWSDIKEGIFGIKKNTDEQLDETKKQNDPNRFNIPTVSVDFDAFNRINKALEKRTTETFKNEKINEKLVQKIAKPVIIIQNGMLQDAKVRTQGL